ncbi:hypothetical protein FBU30_004126 [Linnemannia zychae]|nr:hypothetical protein FBU30_004126 [Linnemannia zychae]
MAVVLWEAVNGRHEGSDSWAFCTRVRLFIAFAFAFDINNTHHLNSVDSWSMEMISSGRSRLHDGARYAAGPFMNPLTSAISEQRRLVDGLSAVSKARVEECKHMMAWSKSQTDDLADVLLKLNLLIRKISDYEYQFGVRYQEFRERIKVLRAKDDTLCDMGRIQNDLQSKLVEKGKSGLRSLIGKETSEDSSKNGPEVDLQLVDLKRKIIKAAYSEQLDAIVELGKKMQIIGEHGKDLLEHIDLSGKINPYVYGRETEGVLQSARIALENKNQKPSGHQDNVSNRSSSPIPKSTPTVAVSDLSSTTTVAPISEAVTAVPPLPPRIPGRMASSDSLEPRRIQKNRARAEAEELLRQQEELELNKALALSLESLPAQGKDVSDLKLTPEEKRFISEQTNPIVPKPSEPTRSTRSPQSVEIGEQTSSQRQSRPSMEDSKIAKTVSTSALEELGGSRKSSEITDAQRTSFSQKKTSPKPKQMPMESMGPEPETYLESMGCDSSVAYESMGDSGMTPVALENLRLQTALSQRKLQELQQSSPFPSSPELQYLQVQPSPQLQKQSLQVSQSPQGTLSLSTPYNLNHSGPMGPNFQSGTPYKPTTTYVPHQNKGRNRNSGPITPPTSEGHSPITPHLQQQRQRQQEFQQQLNDEGRTISLQAKRSLQQQQELQKKLQDFYFTNNEQENTERHHVNYHNHSGHRQQPSGSWDYHPDDSDGDYQYKEEYHSLHR